jgi:hypothetical protein
MGTAESPPLKKGDLGGFLKGVQNMDSVRTWNLEI